MASDTSTWLNFSGQFDVGGNTKDYDVGGQDVTVSIPELGLSESTYSGLAGAWGLTFDRLDPSVRSGDKEYTATIDAGQWGTKEVTFDPEEWHEGYTADFSVDSSGSSSSDPTTNPPSDSSTSGSSSSAGPLPFGGDVVGVVVGIIAVAVALMWGDS